MVLELEGQELNVGDFRADILCRNTKDGSRVLIENQLERSDHKHFGQIMTYASNPDIQTVIWIAKEFRAEHLAALDHLNGITHEKFRYFGIEIRVWQIGDSTPAPQFEIVSKPKDWNRTISLKVQRVASDELIRVNRLLLDRYWAAWDDYVIQKFGTPSFLNFNMEHDESEFCIDVYLSHEKKEIGIKLHIGRQNATEPFELLKQQQEEIEREFAEPLEWNERPLYAYNWIFLRKTDIDPTDETDWPNQHEWLASKLELFDKVFRPRIKALNAADWELPEDEDEE